MFKDKKVYTIALIIISIISTVYLLSHYKRTDVSNNEESTKNEDVIDKISPGVTTKEEVLQLLGTPNSSESGTLEYKTKNNVRNNEIIINNYGIVRFVKKIITTSNSINFEKLTTEYGESGYLYGEDAINGYYLYYQPEKGVAYLANPIVGNVLEVWYFTPTTYQDFKSRYASDYSEKYKGNY